MLASCQHRVVKADGHNGQQHLHRVYLTYWTAAAKDHIRKETGALPAGSERNIDIMLEFYLGGILNAYLYLLRNCPDTSLDEAISLISDNVVYGLPGTLARRAKAQH